MPTPMVNKPLPPIAMLRRTFKVSDDNTGIIRLVSVPGTRARAGDYTPNVRDSGCRSTVMYEGENYLVQRFIYALHTGRDPGHLNVLHIDHDPTNCSSRNLIAGTQKLNCHHRSEDAGRNPEDIGIYELSDGKWQARFHVQHLGRPAIMGATTKEGAQQRLQEEWAKYESDPDNYQPPTRINSTGQRWVTKEGTKYLGGFTLKKKRYETPRFDTAEQAYEAVLQLRTEMNLPIDT